ncbi:hypothetical protein ACE01N_07990 [Saccharicrinis sp. FJH2]|uniref:hypothetical protein n=1 Tax=Saccharicrinis sp. FJH65 TaxID=3344659 RepID=UPI0035F34115
MKKVKRILSVLVLSLIVLPGLTAQEFSTGLDIYSSYIWRGAKFGSGPAFQPYVEFSAGDFALGAWGSVSASTDEALEMDLYASYSFGPVSIALTDYYFGGSWTDYTATHSLEPSLGLALGDFSFTAAAMLLAKVDAADAVAEAPAMVNLETGVITPAVEASPAVVASGFGETMDLYFEAGYSFETFDIALGAGNGQYTRTEEDEDGKFNICNISVGTSKEVKITDSFSLPISGAVILNPATGGFFITVGISL